MRKISTLDGGNRIEFKSKALPADSFAVIDFSGEEGMSRLYRFEINLVSENASVNLDAVLEQGASLTIVQAEQQTVFHGILAEFEELHQKDGDTYYRAVLVPRLWQLSLYRVNEVYVDKSTPDVIKKVLEEAGFTALDYEFALTGTYTPWTHLCEYQESHFDFISRLMERDGLYYYFAQEEQRAKLIVTDVRNRHQPIAGARAIVYEPISGLRPNLDKQSLFTLICRQRPLPNKVILMDYNYRKPSLELKSEVVVDAAGRGDVYLYGEHADTQAESRQLAEIRAQELRCRKRTFHGESSIAVLRPGYLADVSGHFRPEFNQRYLITEISHEGSQAGMLLHGGSATSKTGGEAPFYSNSFTAIAAEVQFRPERLTPKPRIHGTMNAVIDAESSGANPELDEHGRYKVWLPLDRAEHGDAKASQWVRMATPYAGQDHGMHFPLRKGTEVLLTFIDGDPNRPIIAGAVPNMETPSVANSDNEKRVVMKLRGGIETNIGLGKSPRLAGVGADGVVYGEIKQDSDTWTAEEWVGKMGTQSWEKGDGYDWTKDPITFDLGDTGTRLMNTVNNVLHSYSTSCERYKGPVVTTITETNSLTVKGSCYTWVGPGGNAETDLANYSSDVSSSQEGDSGPLKNLASFMQLVGDSMSSTRTAANPTGSSVTVITGTCRTTVRGTNVSLIEGDSDTTVRADSYNKYVGRTNNMFIGNTFIMYFGTQETISLANNLAINLGLAETFNLTGSFTLAGPVNVTMNYGSNTTIDVTKSGFKVNQTDAAISKLQSSVSTTDAAVAETASRVSKVTAAVNDVKSKVNEVVTLSNKLDAGMNHLATYNTRLSNSMALIDNSAIKVL